LNGYWLWDAIFLLSVVVIIPARTGWLREAHQDPDMGQPCGTAHASKARQRLYAISP
jgi:hypothetical protein